MADLHKIIQENVMRAMDTVHLLSMGDRFIRMILDATEANVLEIDLSHHTNVERVTEATIVHETADVLVTLVKEIGGDVFLAPISSYADMSRVVKVEFTTWQPGSLFKRAHISGHFSLQFADNSYASGQLVITAKEAIGNFGKEYFWKTLSISL